MNSRTGGIHTAYAQTDLLVALEECQMTFTTFPNYMVCCQRHMLHNWYNYCVGTTNLKKPLDLGAWCHCYENYAHLPQPFYPDEFDEAARAILNTDLTLTPNELTMDIAEAVYTHLLNTLS